MAWGLEDHESQSLSPEAVIAFTSAVRLPILAVDDRPENLVALEAVLAPLGHSVVTATSGEEALRLLLERDFALILLDVRMPGLDGIETARLIKLREHTKDIPIVFLTAAHNEVSEIVRGYDVGAVDYVLKPFEAELLRSKVAVFAELEQGRRDLRRSEAFLRSAFEAAPIGKTVLDASRRIVRANAAFARVVGRDQEALTGAPILELCHPDDRAELAAVLEIMTGEAALDAADGLDIDIRLITATGRTAWVSPTMSPIVEAEASAPLLLVQWVDVTARRRAEKARAELLIEQSARTQAEANSERLERLQKLTEPIDSRALADVLTELVRRLVDALDAEAAELWIDDGELSAACGPPSGREAGAEPPDEHWHELALTTVDGAIGTLRVGFGGPRSLTGSDRALLRDAAERTSLVIRRAQLHEREHRIAVELQRGLLPTQLPDVPGLEMAAHSEAAGLGTEVGGDWYDAFLLPGDRLGVVIGDVTGSGIRAASMMGQLRSVTRAFALADAESPSPAEVLTRVHRYHKKLGLEQLFTVLYLVLDPSNGSVVWANAGHPPPVLRSDGGGARLLHGSDSMMAYTDVAYRDRHATALPGDALVLYTDGLVERRDEAIDAGLARLLAVVQEGPIAADAMCAHVLSAATEDPAASDDDVTAVVMRVLEHYPTSGRSDVRGPQQRIEVVLAADLGAATTARRLLEQAFGTGLGSAELDRAKLAVSELATNAVRHGVGDITLRAELDESRLLVEVSDEGPGFARTPRVAAARDVGGWGLELVEGASSRWGITDGSAHVWFEIERGGDGPARSELG
jgi:PAS domain S-box-containing protein